MNSCWLENLPADLRKAVEELLRGRDFANQLKTVLNQPVNGDGSVSAEDLVTEILNSFTVTLSIFKTVDSDEMSQFPASLHVDSPCWDGRKLKDSGESIKSSRFKDRRGCYKRRKTSFSWINDSSTLIDDGHAWRKYGQKVILKSKYPRNYFRCTHKHDQGCQALKQVQRIEEDPCVYRTTYYGHHTCKNFLKDSQIQIESPTDCADSSVVISFTNNPSSKQDSDNTFLTTSFQPVKQEYYSKDEIASQLTHNQSSSSDYLVSPAFDQTDAISSGVNSSSCTTSSHSFDMDMMMGSVDFHDDDVLQFDFC